MCFGEVFVLILGSSLKVFGFRPYLVWYLYGRLVGMEVLQEKLMLTFQDNSYLTYRRILELNCDLEYYLNYVFFSDDIQC